MAELILSDGTRSYDFLAEPSPAIYVQQDGLVLPVVSREDTYAEGSDSEGRTRVRSRALNSEAGSFSVFFKATSAALFWDAVDNLQELVESAHRNKGTLTYAPPGGVAVTFDLEAINVTDLPQKGVHLRQFHGEATVSFESKPYGRLASEPVQITDTYAALSATYNVQAARYPLDATSLFTDTSGYARHGTAQGGITAGGQTGPFPVGDNGATRFDGTNDYVRTSYITRRNLNTNPNLANDATGYAAWFSSCTATRSNVTAAEGAWSLEMSAAGGLNYIGVTTPVTASVSTTYSLGTYVRVPTTGTYQVVVQDAGGNWTTTIYNGSLTANVWTWVSGSFTTGGTNSGAMVIRVDRSTNYTAATKVYIDAICTELGSTGGAYFPTSAQLSSGEAGWLGTANASQSDMGCFANGTVRTFSCWVKVLTSGMHNVIGRGVSGTEDFALRVNGASGAIDAYTNSTTVSLSPSAAVTGPWMHLVVVADEPGDTMKLYKDGSLVSSVAWSAQWGAPHVENYLSFGTFAGSFMNGHLSYVTVHQRALTADEILNLFRSGIATKSLTGPIDYFTVPDVPGQVDAHAELTIQDGASVARNHVEVGVQHDFDPFNPEPLILYSVADLSALGGSSTTRAGSISTNVLRAALTTSPVAICTSDEQPHEGLWKVRVRVYPSATDVRVRLAWRAGDGPFAKEKWVPVPNSSGWFDLDLGTVNIKELPSGHTSEFRVEAFATSGVPTVDVDYIELIPCDNYTKLRGAGDVDDSGPLVAADDFALHASGGLSGKTPALVPAGNWSGAGDSDDFSISASRLNRIFVSDSALNNGRYARCGSGVLAGTIVQVDFNIGTDFSNAGRFGVFARYVDTSNWLMAVYLNTSTISLIKRVSGTETTLATATGDFFGNKRTLALGVDAAGNAVVHEGPSGGPLSLRLLTLADAALVTSGTLDDGGYGIYDAITASSADQRSYYGFLVKSLPSAIVNPVINAGGYNVKLTHETALTQGVSSTGTTPIREGKYLTLPPSTRNGTKSRIVIKARPDDSDLGFADNVQLHPLAASLIVTPRVHLTGT